MGQKIYWTDFRNNSIQRADSNGSHVEELVNAGLVDPYGIAVDSLRKKINWADGGTGKIQRAELDGSNVQDVVIGLNTPFGIALDVFAAKMYWTDMGVRGELDGRIQRANLDGSGVEDVVTSGLADPTGLALDLVARQIYWADTHSRKIQRCGMLGSPVEDVIVGGALYTPIQVALDVSGRKLYWTFVDFEGAGGVDRANLDGTQIENLVYTGTGVTGPGTGALALDLRAQRMYWTQTDGKIVRANLDGYVREVLVTGLSGPQGLALDLPPSIPATRGAGLFAMALLVSIAAAILIARRGTCAPF